MSTAIEWTKSLMSDDNGKLVSPVLKGVAISLIASYLTASTAVLFFLSSQLRYMDARLDAHAARLVALESGSSTPMAKETREAISSLWRALEEMRKDHK